MGFERLLILSAKKRDDPKYNRCENKTPNSPISILTATRLHTVAQGWTRPRPTLGNATDELHYAESVTHTHAKLALSLHRLWNQTGSQQPINWHDNSSIERKRLTEMTGPIRSYYPYARLTAEAI
jgi:hypothetical protein